MPDIHYQIGFWQRRLGTEASVEHRRDVWVIDVEHALIYVARQRAVNIDVVVSVAVVVEPLHHAFCLDGRWLIARGQLSIEVDVGFDKPEMVVLEDALKVDAIGGDVSRELPSIKAYCHLCIAGIGFELTLHGKVFVDATQRAHEGDVAQACHLFRYLDGFLQVGSQEFDALAVEEQLPDVRIPSWMSPPVAERAVGL